MSKWGSNLEPFAHENDAVTARSQLHEAVHLQKEDTHKPVKDTYQHGKGV